MSIIPIQKEKTLRGNSLYQQRQQQRRHHLEKKWALRKTFELGKLIEKVGLHEEDLTVIGGLLLEAKEKLQSAEAENTRSHWHVKGEDYK
jgi:hypothetical protein